MHPWWCPMFTPHSRPASNICSTCHHPEFAYRCTNSLCRRHTLSPRWEHDLCYSPLERMRTTGPERWLNCGIRPRDLSNQWPIVKLLSYQVAFHWSWSSAHWALYERGAGNRRSRLITRNPPVRYPCIGEQSGYDVHQKLTPKDQ